MALADNTESADLYAVIFYQLSKLYSDTQPVLPERTIPVQAADRKIARIKAMIDGSEGWEGRGGSQTADPSGADIEGPVLPHHRG